MACLIKFVRLNDFAADIDELDLTANGYGLAQDGYFPTAAPDDVESVREVITLKLQGTSKDDLAAMTQEIDEKIKQVGWWLKDPGIERYQVWLRVQLENESLPRQAQIISIMPPDKVRVFTPEEKLDNYIGEYQIGIERTPFWEDPYPYPTTAAINNINCLGGAAALSETINGDVNARVAHLGITPDGSASLGKYWIGWKTSRFGNPANFIPTWSIAASHIISGTDTSTTADGTAYSGTRVTTSFATVATPLLRTITYLIDIAGANPSDQRGSYTVLLRAKMSDASTARVRLIYGFTSIASNIDVIPNPFYNSRVPISGTGWKLYDVGIAKIPPFIISPDHLLYNIGLGLMSERNTGAGSLYIDCLILIPRNDGMIKLNVANEHATPEIAHIYQKADESLSGYTTFTNLIQYNVTPSGQTKWGITPNNPIYIIFAADGLTTSNANTSTADITYTYIPRWRTLRGNVT